MAAMPPSHGPRQRLGTTDAVTIAGVPYRVTGHTAEGYVLQNTVTGLFEDFDHPRLTALSQAGRLEISVDHHGAVSARTRLKAGCGSLAALPSRHQRIVAWKTEWITEFLKWEERRRAEYLNGPTRYRKRASLRGRAAMERALDEIDKTISARADARSRPLAEDGTLKKPRKLRCGSPAVGYNGPSLRQFRVWLKQYEEAKNNPYILRPKTARCGNRRPRYAPEVERLLQEYAARFASEEKPSRAKCHRELRVALAALNEDRRVQGLPPYAVPSDRTLCRRIAALDMFLVEAKRLGPDRAMRKHRPLVGQAEAIRPGQRVEMDEWKIDLFHILSQTDLFRDLSEEQRAALRKRRWFLCVAVDVATRCILGLRVDHTASVRNALATLEMIVSDKRSLAAAAGAASPWHHMMLRPETVITDGGASFLAEVFHIAVLALGGAHDIPPAGMPHLRGTIERLFRTLGSQLVSFFTGQSFSSKHVRGDYPAMERASVTIEEFVLAVVRYAVDIYHQTPHEGLGGETPFNAWTRLTDLYGVIPVPGRNERRAIFGLRIDRTLGRHGVRFMGLDYRSDLLRDLYLKRGGVPLAIRVDPQDIGAISVEVDGLWHEVRAATSGFDGLSLSAHQALCGELRKRFADQAKLSEPVVFEAVKALRDQASAAKDAATFLCRFNEPEDIARAEKALRGFSIPTDEDFAVQPVADPLDGLIPTGPGPTPSRSDGGTTTDDAGPIKPRRPRIGLDD